MGHHINTDGNFQSDKYAWLSPNRILFSWSDNAFRSALAATGYKNIPFDHMPGKALFSFRDSIERVVIGYYSEVTPDVELARDIQTVLKTKFGFTDEELKRR